MGARMGLDVQALPDECRCELVDLIWWFSRAPRDVQALAVGLIRPFLDGGALDRAEFSAAVSGVTEMLREAARQAGPPV